RSGRYIGRLVEEEREAQHRLVYAELPQVEVDHDLAELGQAGAGGLHAVAVGHVKEMDGRHRHPPGGTGRGLAGEPRRGLMSTPWHFCRVSSTLIKIN